VEAFSLLYKLIFLDETDRQHDAAYGFVREPFAFVARHSKYSLPENKWKAELNERMWAMFGERSWDWTIMETKTPVRELGYVDPRVYTGYFALFENKSDAALARLALEGRVEPLEAISIREYLGTDSY
jgi:hypothetical protein